MFNLPDLTEMGARLDDTQDTMNRIADALDEVVRLLEEQNKMLRRAGTGDSDVLR